MPFLEDAIALGAPLVSLDESIHMKPRLILGLLLVSVLAGSAVAASPPTATTNLPKVLIIGDSISLGYTPVVQDLLQGVAEVSHPNGNCQFTGNGLKNIQHWLGTQHWAVIHFNFGIWDTHLLDTNGTMLTKEPGPQPPPGTHLRYTPAEYRANLTKLVEILEGTGARLIWASTTPVMVRTGPRFNDIITNNVNAAAIMQAHHIAVDDLYAFVLPHVKTWQHSDGCHFLPAGSAEIGKQVAASIQQALRQAQPHDSR